MVRPKLSQASENVSTLFRLLALVVAFSAQSSLNRNSLRIAVFTLVLARNLLTLKTEPSVRYRMPIPLSEPLNASNSIAENMILKRVGTRTHPCLTPFVRGKGYETFSVVLHPFMRTVMKLSNDGHDFFGAAVFCYDSSEAVSVDHVKCLGQINISRLEVSVLFLTLLWHLSCSRHHVNSLTFLTEASLTLQ